MARLLGYADNDIYPLAAAMEMFHVATLLHDDVMDNAEMRRGSTATHKVFGVTETILAGDALLAKGNQIVAGFRGLPPPRPMPLPRLPTAKSWKSPTRGRTLPIS